MPDNAARSPPSVTRRSPVDDVMGQVTAGGRTSVTHGNCLPTARWVRPAGAQGRQNLADGRRCSTACCYIGAHATCARASTACCCGVRRNGCSSCAVIGWNSNRSRRCAPAGRASSAAPRCRSTGSERRARATGCHVDLSVLIADMREADDGCTVEPRLVRRQSRHDPAPYRRIVRPLADGTTTEDAVPRRSARTRRGQGGRETDTEITVSKNGGGAHLDLMVALALVKADEAERP